MTKNGEKGPVVPAYVAILGEAGQVIDKVRLTYRGEANPLSSGSLGYTAGWSTVLADGESYTANCNITQTGSKDPERAALAAKLKAEKADAKRQAGAAATAAAQAARITS